MAATKTNIGTVFKLQGKLSAALKMYQQAVAVQEKLIGAQHPDTAASMMGVANVLRDMNKQRKALEKYNQVLGIQQTVLGHEHPAVADTQNNIASVLKKQGKPAEVSRRSIHSHPVEDASHAASAQELLIGRRWSS